MTFGEVVAVFGAVELFALVAVLAAMIVADGEPIRLGVEPRAEREEHDPEKAKEAA